ncbi:hypothetical protein [Micromonospora orduensis]|uniref:hypothetical protein n=1 Tax=Micromonospora orduensis TaxID=1420891 RepID=UPI00362A62C7
MSRNIAFCRWVRAGDERVRQAGWRATGGGGRGVATEQSGGDIVADDIVDQR